MLRFALSMRVLKWMNFGERLKEVRKEKSYTLEKLADLCNTSETVIRNYEKSRRIPSIKMLVKLCNSLDVTPYYFLQDELTNNPCSEMDRLINEIESLSPNKKSLLIDFLQILKKH